MSAGISRFIGLITWIPRNTCTPLPHIAEVVNHALHIEPSALRFTIASGIRQYDALGTDADAGVDCCHVVGDLRRRDRTRTRSDREHRPQHAMRRHARPFGRISGAGRGTETQRDGDEKAAMKRRRRQDRCMMDFGSGRPTTAPAIYVSRISCRAARCGAARCGAVR